MKTLAPFIVLIVLIIVITVLLNNWMNTRLKNRIIDTGYLDENIIKDLLQSKRYSSEDVIKWIVLILFASIGLIVLEFVPYDPKHSSLPYGIEGLFISAGFFVYWLIMKKQKNS